MHKIKITTPKNISKTLTKTATLIRSNGGTFVGDESSGRFSGSGVKGSYKLKKNSLDVIVEKIPFFFPMSAVENKIREYFQTA